MAIERKIIKVVPAEVEFISIASRGGVLEYRREKIVNVWERLWGISWEPVDYPEEIEKLYQEYIK